MTTKAIYLDCDGTFVDFYGVEGWLDCIKKEYTKPYREAKPLVNMRELGKELNRLQKQGYVIGIITWLAKGASKKYNDKIAKAKRDWLHKHLSAVQFDEVHILEYGTPKEQYGKGILFDDEEHNRKQWMKVNSNIAFNELNIINVLRMIK